MGLGYSAITEDFLSRGGANSNSFVQGPVVEGPNQALLKQTSFQRRQNWQTCLLGAIENLCTLTWLTLFLAAEDFLLGYR